MKLKKTVFAAIRRDSYNHHEFIDMMTISDSYNIAVEKRITTSKANPEWSYANPIRRISRFELKEI